MNSKTAKLIRRFSHEGERRFDPNIRAHYLAAKRGWNRTPRAQRKLIRQDMKTVVRHRVPSATLTSVPATEN